MSEFPRPSIPLLQGNTTIDLEELEGNLVTYIKYQGIARGDLVYPAWRGCGCDGQAHDLVGTFVEVSDDNGYTEAGGLPIAIPRHLMLALDQGWSLYSYAVARQGGPVAGESLRQFCYVGVRPRSPVLLPVVQMRDSHDLVLDPDNVSASNTLAVAPPYLAMRPNDKVTFSFTGYIDGVQEPTWSQAKTLASADVGRPVTWEMPKSELIWVEGGYAEASYRVDYASGEQSSSVVQTFQIGPETTPRQAAPWVDGHEDEESIDPGLFPDGLYLRVEPWPGMADGDQFLLHWNGGRPDNSVIKSLRIDASVVDSGMVEVWIEPQWLQGSIGGEVRVFHQFAREGLSLSGETLTLAIRQPLDLTPPIIENAIAEGGAGENKGALDASKGLSGVYVEVPQGVPLGPDDHLEVHWAGHPAGGQHVAPAPVSPGNPRRFHVPSTAVAANIGAAESKRFDVFYRLTPAGQPAQASVPFHLRITPAEVTRYPHVQCLQADTTHLSLAKVPAAGADLSLLDWWYFAEGQLLTIEAEGVGAGGTVSLIVRNAGPITPAEFAAKEIKAKLLREFLTDLKLNENFVLKARLSYDGGETQIPFPATNLQLLA